MRFVHCTQLPTAKDNRPFPSEERLFGIKDGGESELSSISLSRFHGMMGRSVYSQISEPLKVRLEVGASFNGADECSTKAGHIHA